MCLIYWKARASHCGITTSRGVRTKLHRLHVDAAVLYLTYF